MNGWNGKILRVNLSNSKAKTQYYDADFAIKYLGGRGFAAKILWDELKPGIDPFSPENKLIFAVGPLTGFALPSSGKLVAAAKSPLTNGYGDGNVGSHAAVKLRKAGYDALVLEGKAENPCYLLVEDEKVDIMDARDLWGQGSFEVEKKLAKKHGREAGILAIGQAGENLIKYATVVSQEGRAGGRAGMGAVMGSKKIKAVAILGNKEIPVADPKELRALGKDAYKGVLEKPGYDFWKRQGTMSVVEWGQENSVLPTHNFKEGIFGQAEGIGGFTMEKLKISQRGCPHCNMTCGNVVEDSEKQASELDYENVALLGSNIGLGDLKRVATLNRMADDYGVDTISLGNAIGFAMECSEKNVIDYAIEWGDFEAAKKLTEEIVFRKGIGDFLADGVKRASEKIGKGSEKWAMHVKGLEVSGYDCHSTPAMALSYGTSPIGAHHKDAWVISWEVSVGREVYNEAKVDKVIELQRIRGGLFEGLVTCRLPWVEIGFEIEWYPKFLKAATGIEISLENVFTIADRIYDLIRAFWIRESKNEWSRNMDYPPERWFNEPLTEGPFKGAKLDKAKYDALLNSYYEKRGWDKWGIPTKTTLEKLGLGYVAQELNQYVQLTP
jgi:aldehyde:ferredoxin oxidoreductase